MIQKKIIIKNFNCSISEINNGFCVDYDANEIYGVDSFWELPFFKKYTT